MKKNYLLMLVLFMPAVAGAQISLTAGMAPPTGSMFIYYDANVPVPAFTFSTSGINNTWDFTTISPLPTEEDTVFIEDPALVPGGTAFPTATHSIRNHDAPIYTMLEITPSAALYLGGVGDIIGAGTPITTTVNPPLTAMSFPYTYGVTGSGTGVIDIFVAGATIGQPLIDSIHFKSTLTVDNAVLAAGDMIIPSGTFPSLLERQINSTVDSAWIKSALTLGQWVPAPGFPTSSTDSTFNWYTDQSLQKYAHAIYDSTGLSDVIFFKSSTTGLPGVMNSDAVTIYPNPTNDQIYFSNAGLLHEMQLQLFDGNGREVMNGKGQIDRLDVSKLQTGIYFLRMTIENGKEYTYRFVKE